MSWIVTHSDGYDLLTNGSEVHVSLHRPGVVSRRSVRAALNPLIEKYGMVTTRTTVGDERSGRFVKKIGFIPSWSDVHYDYYILSEQPFARREVSTCQQQ